MPVLALAPRDGVYEKLLSNVEEVKARKGRIILVANTDDRNCRRIAERLISVPESHEALQPLLFVLPLQLLAYEIAKLRGCDVDQPRNLAKSVTVG